MGCHQPQHRLFFCVGLFFFVVFLLQQAKALDKHQKSDDLTFESSNNNQRVSRSLDDVHSVVSSHANEENHEHWITKSIHRIKRGFLDFWGNNSEENVEDTKTTSTTTENAEDEDNTIDDGQTHIEDDDPDENLPPDDNKDDDYEQFAFETSHGSKSTVHKSESQYSNSDDFADDEDLDGMISGSGKHEAETPTIHSKHPVYYRVRFTLMEPFNSKLENHYSDEYKRLSEQIVDNVDQLFKDFEGNQTSTVVKIQKRKEDMFSSLVTVDIQSEHNSDSAALRKKISHQINNYNAIGSLSVKPDDFQFQAFEGVHPNLCSDDEIECRTTGECVPISSRCDNNKDCPDGTDEENCDACAVGELSCDISRCIPESQRCDGIFHCEDKTDEHNCPAKACHSGQFRCDNGDCIEGNHRCDGRRDCYDGEDEYNCPSRPHDRCDSTQFQCGDGTCISKSKKCDTFRDCSDGADEKYCPCKDFEFTCANGNCILEHLRCDGRFHCQDKSDEQNCQNFNRTSMTHFYKLFIKQLIGDKFSTSQNKLHLNK